MSDVLARGSTPLLSALTREPTSTSDLYDRVGYGVLVTCGLIPYESFRSVLEGLVAAGLAERATNEDGATLWWRAEDGPEAQDLLAN